MTRLLSKVGEICRDGRGIFDILVRILTILEVEPCNSNTLAGRINLATPSLRRFIDMLLQLNLVSKDYSNGFKISDKGRTFLQEYEKLVDLIGK